MDLGKVSGKLALTPPSPPGEGEFARAFYTKTAPMLSSAMIEKVRQEVYKEPRFVGKMNTTNIITVTIIGLLAVMSPGPDFLIVTRNSVLYSKRVGLCTALGIAMGTVWWVAASLLGISLVISKTVLVFNILKWFGAAYLIYLGVKSFRTNKATTASENGVTTPASISPLKGFLVGLGTNALNPKAALFFVSFFSIIITPATPIALRAGYGLEISFIALVWFSLLATVLATSKVKAFFERISVWLNRVTGAVLIVLGVKLALTRSR
jgi:RhtB (resistance to homoserine/threonine) family protein